ncbi:zinc finger MYM-type protein 1-like [Oratosquilla oratoria]|uniref:zinc finger MYM-type protein 1-like n=1 Tax=Oratosquilla oratoria TaxID=337810 RepID=UPI003F7665B9
MAVRPYWVKETVWIANERLLANIVLTRIAAAPTEERRDRMSNRKQPSGAQNRKRKAEQTSVGEKADGIEPAAVSDIGISDVNCGDPATWPDTCNNVLRQLLVQHGPQHISSYNFPKDSKNRRFSPIHYKRRLSNGEENTTAILSVHERSTEHIDNYQTWRELELRLKQGKTIDHIEQQSLKQEEKYWQNFLERLIALSRVLAVQNLAFRGTNESLYSPNNGNFLKLVEFLALFDPVMNEHLRRIKNKETMVHYLGKRIQNELIQLLASAIKEKILAEVKLAKYFSIISDCTPDISHIEQLTTILRYVDIKKEPEVLVSIMKDLTIKPLSETRWESRIDALKPLRYHLADIYDALLEIYEDTNLKGSSGSSTRVEAKELADAVSKYEFVVSLVTWYNILFEVNITSKHFQDKDADLNSATKQLEATKSYLLSCRCDDGFQKVLVDATEVAQDLEIEPQFEKKQSRKRRKKRLFDYEAHEESLEDPSQTFKVEFYYSVLDMAIQSVEERFHQLHSYKAIFGFLYDIHGIKNAPNADILHDCQNLEKSLTHNGHHDIDARDLCSELKAVSRRLTKPMLPQAALCFIFEQKLQDSVPNVVIAHRILLTLPVSVASGERSFSKLKLIKTYLRSTMLQQRLVGLATISIENEEASNLDLAKLVEKFASLKARKLELLSENIVVGGAMLSAAAQRLLASSSSPLRMERSSASRRTENVHIVRLNEYLPNNDSFSVKKDPRVKRYSDGEGGSADAVDTVTGRRQAMWKPGV